MEKNADIPEYSAGGEPITPTPSEPPSPEKAYDDTESASLIKQDSPLGDKMIPLIKVSS